MVSEKFIFCNGCTFPYHIDCAGFDKQTHDIICDNKNIKWFCDSCKGDETLINLHEKINIITVNVNQILNILNVIKKSDPHQNHQRRYSSSNNSTVSSTNTIYDMVDIRSNNNYSERSYTNQFIRKQYTKQKKKIQQRPQSYTPSTDNFSSKLQYNQYHNSSLMKRITPIVYPTSISNRSQVSSLNNTIINRSSALTTTTTMQKEDFDDGNDTPMNLEEEYKLKSLRKAWKIHPALLGEPEKNLNIDSLLSRIKSTGAGDDDELLLSPNFQSKYIIFFLHIYK